jgi:ABC-2 type transport system ATP-binding protein
MYAIEARSLTRVFSGLRAVDGITFAVQEGEVFGFLGPNGAGKTTTIRLLTGQLRPTAGHARVAGCDVVRELTLLKPQIGVVFEQQNLYERMSAQDNLDFAAQLFGVRRESVAAALQRVGLQGRAGDLVKHYSNGMKQRLLIARALLHGPQVLFLDEPTKGLDPSVARQIRALIVELAQRGMTVFLTTHYMEEADQLCHRVAFLNQGRVVALDTPARLKATSGQRSLRLTLESGKQIRLSLDDPADGRRVGELAAAGQVLTLHSEEPTLEDVFLRLTGKELLK